MAHTKNEALVTVHRAKFLVYIGRVGTSTISPSKFQERGHKSDCRMAGVPTQGPEGKSSWTAHDLLVLKARTYPKQIPGIRNKSDSENWLCKRRQ